MNNINKIGFIIQARMGSNRLPNKVLANFHKEISILKIIIDNLKIHFKQIPILVATTINKKDDAIVQFCKTENVNYFRGSEQNVLKRFTEAAINNNFEKVIRICADNPFLDMNYLKQLIEYGKDQKYDYVSFQNNKSVPVIKTHLGLFAEIVNLDSLNKTLDLTSDKLYLEHVTNYIYSNKNTFKVKLLDLDDSLKNREDLRFTIDDKADFENVKKIYKHYIENKLNFNQVIEYVDNTPTIKSKMLENIKKYTK